MKKASLLYKIKTICLHTVAGILIFYFLLHPLAMTMNIDEGKELSQSEMWQEILNQIHHSFSFTMLPMAYLFIIAGAIIGVLSGFLWLSLISKKLVVASQDQVLAKDTLNLIEEGENHKVEFKSSIRFDFHQKITNKKLEKVIAKTIVGFMNADGGKLLIGVQDNGEIVGLQKDFSTLRQKNEDGFERRIFDLITTQIGAEFCHLCTIYFNSISDQIVCTVQIEPSTEPVFLHEADTTLFYIRAGNATRPLSVKETLNYLEMRSQKKLIG